MRRRKDEEEEEEEEEEEDLLAQAAGAPAVPGLCGNGCRQRRVMPFLHADLHIKHVPVPWAKDDIELLVFAFALQPRAFDRSAAC